MTYHVTAAYYSPTGGTKAATLGLAKALDPNARELDLSAPVLAHSYAFGPEDLVVFGGPVFGGCLPDPMLHALHTCRAQGALAVAAAVYGNRAFDDALLQLCDVLGEQGFTVIAGAGLLARHSLATEIAANRPDANDFIDYAHYATAIRRKLEKGDLAVPCVPGNRPAKPFAKSSVTPLAGDACTHCGVCAQSCPVGAIDPKTLQANTQPCFLCMRCVFVCPQGARALPREAAQAYHQKLSGLANLRRPNELFV